MPLTVFGGTKHDVWVSAVLAGIIGLIGCYVVIALALKYPEQTIVQYSQEILGTWLGKFLGFIYIGFFILMASVSARDFSELLLNYTVERIPISVYMGVIILTAAYALFAGLSAIGRLAEIIVPLILMVTIFGIMASVPNVHYLPSLPLKHDFTYLLNEAMLELPSLGMASSLLILIPMLREKAGVRKPLLISIALAGIATVLVAAIVVGVLGPYGTTSINYPFFFTFQQITILPSIPHFDMLFIFAWISTSFLTVAIYYYIAVLAIQQLLSRKSYRPFIAPIGILIIFTAIFAFPNFHDFKQFLQLNRVGIAAIPLDFVIPSFLLLLSYVKYAHLQKNRRKLQG